MVLAHRIESPSRPYLLLLAATFALIATSVVALLAIGIIGPIHFSGSPVDQEIVLSSIAHALLGCLLSAILWLAGAGIASVFSREQDSGLAHLLLLGFPWGLLLTAISCWIILVAPFGSIFGLAGLATPIAALFLHRVNINQFRPFMKLGAALMPPSAALGCWCGFLLHGPTRSLAGHPFGDVSYYATNMYTLQIQPFPMINLANEGEYLSPFNQFHPLLGATLMRFLPIDPYQFVLATGGSMYLFGLGVAVYAYLSLHRTAHSSLAYVILAVSVLVATWYPLWIVASTPMIVALPVTVSVWYRATSERGATSALSNFSAAVVGTVLGKVTSVLTLAPLAFANLVVSPSNLIAEWRKVAMPIRCAAMLVFALTLVYAGYMLANFGPKNLQEGIIGPDSWERYQWVIQSHLPRRTVLPYLLRDVGTILLIPLAFRILNLTQAAVITGGLVSALVFPYAMRVNLDCVLIIIALAGIDRPDLLDRNRALALTSYLLCLPVIIHQDYGGGNSMTAIWLLSLGTMCAIVFARSNQARDGIVVSRRLANISALIFAGLLSLGLVAIARQNVVFRPPAGDPMAIPSAARDIWSAVREKTPPNALIFTDQTGTEPGALASWNTYAATGQRQIYLAGWYQTHELRLSPQLLMLKLRENESILSGKLRPTDLSYRRGPYASYYSVVNLARKMPPVWLSIYANTVYALYQYNPPSAPKQP